MHKLSEVSLALDESIGDVHLAAELRKPEHKLNRVDIGSNDDELGLLFFNEFSHMLETELQHSWLLIVGLGT